MKIPKRNQLVKTKYGNGTIVGAEPKNKRCAVKIMESEDKNLIGKIIVVFENEIKEN